MDEMHSVYVLWLAIALVWNVSIMVLERRIDSTVDRAGTWIIGMMSVFLAILFLYDVNGWQIL